MDEAPAGEGSFHEIKYDGYRMHARIDGRYVKLLTRTGLDWSHRHQRTIEALRGLNENSTSCCFNLMQLPSSDKNQRPSYEAAVVWLCR